MISNKHIKNETFINKYKPYFLKDYNFSHGSNELLNDFIELDMLNVLFIGNSCSGKTTLLNIIVREYYGLDKNASFPENNILHINNLKDQGIHFFRNEMRTFCQSRSSIFGKKKMVIIDDLDNINEQSQQVFRNYIDKYKKNVHFVSVCSNLQKVIDSLQSRLHLIRIELPTKEDLQIIMDKITAQEKLNIDSESQNYILQLCGNSIRMLINFLEKIYIYNGNITIEKCSKICGTMPLDNFNNYVMFLQNNEINEANQIFLYLHDQGYSVIDIFDAFFTFIKSTFIISETIKYKLIPVLCKYIKIFHTVHEHPIEIVLFTNSIAPIIYNN